jgi:hypothetical protein
MAVAHHRRRTLLPVVILGDVFCSGRIKSVQGRKLTCRDQPDRQRHIRNPFRLSDGQVAALNLGGELICNAPERVPTTVTKKEGVFICTYTHEPVSYENHHSIALTEGHQCVWNRCWHG